MMPTEEGMINHMKELEVGLDSNIVCYDG